MWLDVDGDDDCACWTVPVVVVVDAAVAVAVVDCGILIGRNTFEFLFASSALKLVLTVEGGRERKGKRKGLLEFNHALFY